VTVSIPALRRSRFRSALAAVAATSTLIGPLLLLVFLIGSLLLSGGQVLASKHPIWGVAIAFPLFPVPALLLTVTTGVGLAALLVLVCGSNYREAGLFNGMAGFTGANLAAVFFFGRAFVEGDLGSLGMFPDESYLQPTLLAAAGLVVSFAFGVIFAVRYDREKKAGRLPEGVE